MGVDVAHERYPLGSARNPVCLTHDDVSDTPHISERTPKSLLSERLARHWFSVVEERAFDQLGELVDPSHPCRLEGSAGPGHRGKRRVRPLRAGHPRKQPLRGGGELLHPVDDARVVVEGRIRWIDDDRVIRDDPVTWAMEFRDGLLVRFIPARTLIEAETILGTSSASPTTH